jgi:hypothetical protein
MIPEKKGAYNNAVWRVKKKAGQSPAFDKGLSGG